MHKYELKQKNLFDSPIARASQRKKPNKTSHFIRLLLYPEKTKTYLSFNIFSKNSTFSFSA